jgi:hypothetical protein
MKTPLNRMLTLLESKPNDDILLILPANHEKIVKIIMEGCNTCQKYQDEYIRDKDDIFIHVLKCGNCGREFCV